VSSINGQVFLKKKEEISSTGDQNKKWNVQYLAPGNYILIIQFKDKTITEKFSKR